MTRDSRRFLQPEAVSRISRLELQARNIVEGFLSGLHRSPYFGQSVEFVQHREYVAGDDPRRIDTAVGQVMRSLDQRDQAAAYQLYRTAVLGRGLSPTQRRLLFDLAVERLSLPLPAGDLQPAQRSGW